MRRTLFRPELDRFDFVPDAQVAEHKAEVLRKTFDDAVPDVVAKLNADFGLYKNVFNIESCCKERVLPRAAERVSLEAGIETATLDYFKERIPREARPKKPKSEKRRKEEKQFEDYLLNRTTMFLQQNAAEILLWRTVLLSVPASSVTEQIFLTPVRTVLEKQGDFLDSDCKVILSDPVPEGLAWQLQRCRQALFELKRKINRGQPALVVLVNKSDADVDCDVVIAYAYEEVDTNVVDIEVCVSSDSVPHRTIRLDLGGSKTGIVALHSWQGNGSWAAFFCAYYAAKTPPLNWVQKWQQYFFPRRVWWWIKRRYYLRSFSES